MTDGSQAGSGAPALLALRGIEKRFGATLANSDVSFEVRPGEVHALVGGNGAGKSTLMAIACGEYRADAGTIEVDGREVRFATPRDAAAHGVTMVHQHFMLVEPLTVLENVLLGVDHDLRQRGREQVGEELSRLGARFEIAVDPEALVQDLGPSARQRVEILIALMRSSRLLILDEPTSVLPPTEIAGLMATIRRLVGEGIAVVFISHKLREVVEVADRISVMRAGEIVSTADAASTDVDVLAALMVGEAQVASAGRRAAAGAPGEEVLRAERLELEYGSSGGREPFDLDVRAGEIVGVAAIEGNGQVELLESIVGLREPRAGAISLAGEDITDASVMRRSQLGVAYIPENPRANGLLAGLPMYWSMLLRGDPPRRRWCRWLVDHRALEQRCREAIEAFDIAGARPDRRIAELSGGNLQKIVLARELERRPRLLVVANPTTGLDVGAAAYVYRRLREERDRGAAILLVSPDLDELEELSDRLLVMYDGRVVAGIDPAETTRTELGLLMGGVTREAEEAQRAG